MVEAKFYKHLQPMQTLEVDFYISQPVCLVEYIYIYIVICPGLGMRMIVGDLHVCGLLASQ